MTHAGTAERDGEIVTAGGRVLNVTGLGPDAGRGPRARVRCGRADQLRGQADAHRHRRPRRRARRQPADQREERDGDESNREQRAGTDAGHRPRRCPRSRPPSRRSRSTRPWSGSSWARRTTSPRCSPPAQALHEAGIRYEVRVLSAHREPEKVARVLRQRAHARAQGDHRRRRACRPRCPASPPSHTDLPVIGVPILGKTLGGLDALLSAVQMPPGVPVACVAIDGAKNAGLLAGRG